MQIAFAHAAEAQGETEAAMAAYKEAIRRDSKRADACIRLAILHDQRGEFRESDSLYRKAIQLQPSNPDIFCDMGYSLYLQRRWAEAERCLKQSLAIQRDHKRAHNNLALVMARTGHGEDALAEFQKAGATASQAHGNLAFTFTMEGQMDEARKQYKLAQAANPAGRDIQERLTQLDALNSRLGSNRAQQSVDPQVALTSATAAP